MPGSDDVTPATPGGAPRLKLTYDDYLLFPDDGKRHELIDGEHERFDRAIELSAAADDVLTTPLLPGLEIPPSQVFAD